MVKSLFGGGSKQTSEQLQGYNALPYHIRQSIDNVVLPLSEQVMADPAQYFAPMGLTAGELTAQQMINPENIGASIQNYLNPYSDYAIRAINEQFEDPASQMAAMASEAGAFGSSRYRNVQGDLEQARLNAIGQNMGAQYNTAFNQMQTGIGNLLGFGGLERGIDLAQRQAPISAASSLMGLYSPIISSAGTRTQTQEDGGGGLLGGLGAIGGLLQGGTTSGLFDAIGGALPGIGGFFGAPSVPSFGGGFSGNTFFPGNVGGGTYF